MNNEKKFGVWLDSQHATIVGNLTSEALLPVVIAHITVDPVSSNSGEKNSNNKSNDMQVKFFKKISSHMQNATYIHVTGTGQAQEQFIHYLASTPQFKNTKTEESTSTKMSDDKLMEYIKEKF